MKFTINSKELSKALDIVSRGLSNKPAIQILSNYLFNINGQNKLSITANDTENDITTHVNISISEISEISKICVDAKRITDLSKKLPDCNIDISINGLKMSIKTPTGEFSISCYDPKDFPKRIELNDYQTEINVPSKEIISLISKVKYAVGTDSLRPQLQGVLMEFGKENLTMVATNSFVLGKSEIEIQNASELRVILPTKPISLLETIAAQSEYVKIQAADRYIVFSCNNTSLSASTFNGKYPDYNRVIPQQTGLQTLVDRKSLIRVLDRTSVCGSNETNLVKLKFGYNNVEVSATDSDYGTDATETLPCNGNAELEIGVNSSLLISSLRAIDSDNINISLTSPDKPIAITSETDENTISLLMPILIQ